MTSRDIDLGLVGRRNVDARRAGGEGRQGCEDSQSDGGAGTKLTPLLRLTDAARATGERKSSGRAGEVSDVVSNKKYILHECLHLVYIVSPPRLV